MSTVEESIDVKRPRAHGVQPVDAVRGVPALHGGRRGDPPDRRHARPLADEDRRRRARVRHGDHRAAPGPPGRLARHRRARSTPASSRSTTSTTTPRGSCCRWTRSPRARRAGRRQARRAQAPRQGRPRPLQGDDRVARRRDRRLARRRRAAHGVRLGRAAHGEGARQPRARRASSGHVVPRAACPPCPPRRRRCARPAPGRSRPGRGATACAQLRPRRCTRSGARASVMPSV